MDAATTICTRHENGLSELLKKIHQSSQRRKNDAGIEMKNLTARLNFFIAYLLWLAVVAFPFIPVCCVADRPLSKDCSEFFLSEARRPNRATSAARAAYAANARR